MISPTDLLLASTLYPEGGDKRAALLRGLGGRSVGFDESVWVTYTRMIVHM